MLQILHYAIRSKLSICDRASCPLHGDARRVCCSAGALKEARSKTRASCEVIRSSLEIALSRSLHHFAWQTFVAGHCNRGALSSVEDNGV